MENYNKLKIIFLVIILFLGISCAPYIKYQPESASKSSKSPKYNISVYHELDPLPPQSRNMGKLSINNAVPSMINCDYNDVIRLAKWKVRRVGGDALHIINIKLPDDINSCYGITANIISFDQNGDEFDLYKHYGSLIVLDLSTMWCGPCNQAGAHAQEVQDQYADQDLIYITVLIEDQQGGPVDLQDLQDWATAYGNTTSPVVAGDRSLLTSGGGTFDLTSWPTFFYMDRDMLIRDIDKGYNGGEVIYSIEWLLTL